MNIAAFRKDLEELINQHSIEGGSHTPDFILVAYLLGCLDAYNKAVSHRDRWFGLEPWKRLHGVVVREGLAKTLDDRIASMVERVTRNESEIGVLSTGEQIAVAVLLDRLDLVPSPYNESWKDAHDRLGVEWLAACRRVAERRDSPHDPNSKGNPST